jgi:hypothetical protein
MRKFRPPRKVGCAVLISLTGLLGACTDVREPIGPEGPHSTIHDDNVGTTDSATQGLQAVPRFALELEIQGALVPGSPITITARGEAKIATEMANFRISAPEHYAASRTGWNAGYRVQLNQPIQAVYSKTLPLAPGASAVATRTLVFPVPGYYRVVTSLVPEFDQLVTRPPDVLVQDVTHEEVWLLIDAERGTMTREFEPSLLPPGVQRSPGPYRVGGWRRVENETLELSSFPSSVMEPASTPGVDDVFVFAYYENHDAADGPTPEPVVGASYTIDFCEYGQGFTCDIITSTITGVTDSQGGIYFNCGDADGFRGEIALSNNVVRVEGVPPQFHGELPRDCGSSINVYVPSNRSYVFKNIRASHGGSVSLLGVSRTQPVKVLIDPALTTSSYILSEDRIYIAYHHSMPTSHIWGPYGVFVAAHEYGHAVHHIALGGIHKSPCQGHNRESIHTATSLRCAFVEGFATYHGVATRPDLPVGWYYLWQIISWYDTSQNSDGSIVESAVAAFLFDITDPKNEPHDSVHYPGSYVAQVISSCRADGDPANGIDHIVYCFEEQIDPLVAGSSIFFPTRSQPPSTFSVVAQKPWDWSASALRDLWTWNLYGQ